MFLVSTGIALRVRGPGIGKDHPRQHRFRFGRKTGQPGQKTGVRVLKFSAKTGPVGVPEPRCNELADARLHIFRQKGASFLTIFWASWGGGAIRPGRKFRCHPSGVFRASFGDPSGEEIICRAVFFVSRYRNDAKINKAAPPNPASTLTRRSLRFRLVEDRAKNALLARFWVITAGQVMLIVRRLYRVNN